jgi:hypothetical protein
MIEIFDKHDEIHRNLFKLDIIQNLHEIFIASSHEINPKHDFYYSKEILIILPEGFQDL